jgi:hypothetical protein
VQRDLRGAQPDGILHRCRLLLRALEDLDRAAERTYDAVRLLKDAE